MNSVKRHSEGAGRFSQATPVGEEQSVLCDKKEKVSEGRGLKSALWSKVPYGLGCVACGLVALGMLPTTLIGASFFVCAVIQHRKREKEYAKKLMYIGMIVAFPLAAAIHFGMKSGILSSSARSRG